jgi:iron(III) transport system permease protein
MALAVPTAQVALPARRAGGLLPGRRGRALTAAALAVAALALLPIAALLGPALAGSPGLWTHLAATVLPVAVADTAILLAGVAVVAITVGTGAAWLVTAYAFPGRRVLEWALLLPLAMPTYVVAYAYLDLLHPIGPVQEAIRAVLGYSGPREFRLPDIRSMAGCILLLGFVLYPYVYIPTRAMLLTQSGTLIEAARTLGVPRRRLFWRVALPLARPAVAIGASLALMEALNDIGAAEFLGVRTLTVTVYTTWVTRSDLAGATQIALALLAVVVLLVWLERRARQDRAFTTSAQRARPFEPCRVGRVKGLGLFAAGALPVLVGFAAPAGHLLSATLDRLAFAGLSPRLLTEAANTLLLSAAATAIAIGLGVVLVAVARLRPGAASVGLRLATLGYAAPGTAVAIGVLIVAGAFDRSVDAAARSILGWSTGLLMLGTGGAVLYAYTVRFLAISAGTLEAGLTRVPRSLDDAARVLGRSALGTVRSVHLPLSKAALAAAALLVFVDCAKELPATLLLRPLNVETLATHLYGEAARGTYEDGAIAALAIVLIGLLPVMLLARVGSRFGATAR